MNHVLFYPGEKVSLVIPNEEDIPLFMKWVNDPEIRPFILNQYPMYEGNEKKWFEKLTEDHEKNQVFGIETKESRELVGIVGIHNIDWRNRRGTAGCIIGEKNFWKQGLGTEAEGLLLKHCFLTLGLEKVCAGILANNPRSLRAAMKNLAVKEGTLVRHHFVNGEWIDQIQVAIFREQWSPYKSC